MDFSVFRFKSMFNLHEVVCLCVGADPGSAPDELPAQHRTAYGVLYQAAKGAAENGARLAERYAEIGTTSDHLFDGWLYPDWALAMVRDPLKSKARMPYDPDNRMYAYGLADWEFTASSVAAWLAVRKFMPAFDFAESARANEEYSARFREQILEIVDEPRATSASTQDDKPLAPVERTKLLLIIGALCKKANIDLNERGAARKISNAVDEAGLDVSERTVFDKVKQIQEAIEASRR